MDRQALPLRKFAVSCLFLPLPQLSRGRHRQISTPPALAFHTFCLLLHKTYFSWQGKRSETHTVHWRSRAAHGVGSSSAAQRCTVALNHSLHSRTLTLLKCCLLPASPPDTGPAMISFCFEVSPQPLLHVTSAYFS